MNELIEDVRRMARRCDLYVAELDVAALLAHLERVQRVRVLLESLSELPEMTRTGRIVAEARALLSEPK